MARSFFSLSLASLFSNNSSSSNTADAFSLQQQQQAVQQQRVCVTTENDEWTEVARRIATDLNIPYFAWKEDVGDDFAGTHILDVVPFGGTTTRDEYALGIRPITPSSKNSKRRQQRPALSLARTSGSPSPHIVDFCPPHDSRIAKRIQSGGSDMLIKAVSPRKIPGGAIVYDLTAGFGQDSLLILENGASQVCMVERDPIVATLLQDALRRRDNIIIQNNNNNNNDDEQHYYYSNSKAKLSLSVGHGATIIKSSHHDAAAIVQQQQQPDVCYLDPMFPPRTKSAAVKKNMQILHSLLESQELQAEQEQLDDQVELLEAALTVAKARVVVKRPIHAPHLGNIKPSFDLRGSVNRFDVYVTSS